MDRPFFYNTSAATEDMLVVTGYLSGLSKGHIKTLGLILGLSYRTVSNTFEGSSQSSYLQSVLAAWFLRQDKVLERGCPSWTVLVRALQDKQLRQNGIAADICRDKHL